MSIDEYARLTVICLTEKYAEQRHIDEALKERDTLRWVAEMNAAKHDAEEVVLNEFVYL